MATPRTGKPRGRPKGSKNRFTERCSGAAKATAKKIEKALKSAFTGDAHAFLMLVYKDPENPIDLRLDAAKAAIRFEMPALAAIQTDGNLNVTVEDARRIAEDARAEAARRGIDFAPAERRAPGTLPN